MGPVAVAVSMALAPDVGRAERLDAGAINKGLHGALSGSAGPYRVPGWDLLFGAQLLEHGVSPLPTAVFRALSRLAQNFRPCGWDHLLTSSWVPCSVSNAFQ